MAPWTNASSSRSSGGVGADLGDLLQSEFPCQYHSFCAQFIGGPGCSPVGDARLGGEVYLRLRGVLLGHGQHAQVRHDEGVHAGGPGLPDGIRQFPQLFVGGQSVQGQIELFAPGVAEGRSLRQLLRGEVLGRGAHTELGEPGIHRVRPVSQGIFQPFQVPRGGQQFRHRKHVSLSFSWRRALKENFQRPVCRFIARTRCSCCARAR